CHLSFLFFFFLGAAPTLTFSLSLHDALPIYIGLFGLSMSFVYRFRKIFAKKKGCRSGQPSYSVNTLTHILFCVFSFLYFQANRLSKVLHILKSFSYPGTGSVIAFIEEFVSIPFQALD